MTKYDGLLLRWSKRERDLLVSYPRRCDGALIVSAFTSPRMTMKRDDVARYDFERSLVDELEARGYDPKTLRLSIKLKEQPPAPGRGGVG